MEVQGGQLDQVNERGDARPTIRPFPRWGSFCSERDFARGSLWDYATGKKIADLKGNPENVLSSGQKDRELAFAKTEQTYYKAELKKREDERKKVADRQKAVEKSLKEAEAKPIAEKKKAMDKALTDSDEAKKAVDKQEESLVVLEKKIPDEETLTKTRTEELKKRTMALQEPEKKEKVALAETAQLEKATKQKEAALAPVLQKIEQNEKLTKPLKAQLAEVEKIIKQLEGMPEPLKQANQKKAGLVAKLKPLQEQRLASTSRPGRSQGGGRVAKGV